MGPKEMYFALCTLSELIIEETSKAIDEAGGDNYYQGYADGVEFMLDCAERLAEKLEEFNLMKEGENEQRLTKRPTCLPDDLINMWDEVLVPYIQTVSKVGERRNVCGH